MVLLLVPITVSQSELLSLAPEPYGDHPPWPTREELLYSSPNGEILFSLSY